MPFITPFFIFFFHFSKVFGPETTQHEFFEGSMKEVVKAYVNGVNGLVFTYGVTNAGKTFTIQGIKCLPKSIYNNQVKNLMRSLYECLSTFCLLLFLRDFKRFWYFTSLT